MYFQNWSAPSQDSIRTATDRSVASRAQYLCYLFPRETVATVIWLALPVVSCGMRCRTPIERARQMHGPLTLQQVSAAGSPECR